MFVPRTPGGELITRLREAELEISKITGNSVTFVEKNGNMIKGMLIKANQWAGENCGRSNCLVCHKGQERGGDCRRRNILYQTSCIPCKSIGRASVYYGESARTAFERGLEHLSDFSKNAEESHMWRHVEEEHGDGEPVEFEMKVLRGHRSAFTRQIHEAVKIVRNKEKNILNSKN